MFVHQYLQCCTDFLLFSLKKKNLFLCCLYVSTVRSPGPAASQQTSQLEQELAEVKGHLLAAEEQNSELAEQLKNANAIVDQYRAVVLTLEDSLKKEKEVKLFFFPIFPC